jgi:hypothetical protein
MAKIWDALQRTVFFCRVCNFSLSEILLRDIVKRFYCSGPYQHTLIQSDILSKSGFLFLKYANDWAKFAL